MSLVEQAYLAYSKKLYENSNISKNTIKQFLPKLDKIIKRYPKDDYLLYNKVRLFIKN